LDLEGTIMRISARISQSMEKKGLAYVAALLFGMLFHFDAQALTINVVGLDGQPITVPFRWLVEEDATKDVNFTPALPGRDLSLSFHTSYMPVVGKGTSASPTIALDPAKRYYVSVLPNSGYQIGGAQVARGDTSVTVTVNPAPIPTAQISVFAFNDNQPINNAPDLPQELGLSGFSVLLFEAGGTYGQSGGQVTQDAFGNPIGTTYDAAGNVLFRGDSTLKTGEDGTLLIKNLAPGKYTIQIVPPAGSNWHQTHTIEGTKGIDAWVKANEPSFFQEFGPPGHHVFIGFVQAGAAVNPATNAPYLNGGATITGNVVNLHNSRPPDYAFYNGNPLPNCWVGLNDAAGSRGLYAGPCNADSSFAIPNVPPGAYQLVVWDEYLDIIFGSLNVTVPAAVTEVALQQVPVFNWFSRLESVVFYDGNQNGYRDDGEMGIPEQAVNLRFRDGSIYQSFPTDLDGYVPFDEVFPFFNWLVAEVDFTRFKATGATIAVDGGGDIPTSVDPADLQYWSYGGKLSPQPQSENGGAPYRTETGQVLLQAFQGFLGQTNVIEWGKVNYASGENGGISGIVQYATTRAEDDPRMAAVENWEPGIPRVQVNLYKDCNGDAVIDRPDCSALGSSAPGGFTLADVDNWPFDRPDRPFPQAEDTDRNNNGAFDQGDALQVVATDSWDDSLPSGCQGDNQMTTVASDYCFDGLRNFNQVRPGVFDGGYAFNGIPAGTYIVEAVTPPGYEHVKEEDKNVDFGDEYVPSPLALPFGCANWDDVDNDGIPGRKVPPFLSLFPDQAVGGAYANQNRPLCDRKQVVLTDRQNPGANFFMFTEVPVAAHIVGMILDDTANEFDPNAPTFGEKHAPAFLPVAIRDWTGREISRVYADQYGTFNALVPSTFSMNLPMPSGVSPNMLTACMNSPMLPNGSIDPHYNRQYSQFCYTFQYLPGKTTYLDTPVVPIAAFAGPGQYPLDCEFPDHTPMINWASGDNGPWVPAATVPRSITITSAESVAVSNPAHNGTTTPATILRDYGFGATQGTVTLNSIPLTITGWTNAGISATIPAGTANGTYQLTVTRGDNGATTKTGLTFTIGGGQPIRVAPGGSIQAAIDAAPNSGSPLILVPPGRYEELVIMHKPVRLQGWGAHSTTINAVKAPAEKLANWRDKIRTLVDGIAANGEFSLLPGQEVAFNAPDNEPVLFGAEEGPGVLVVGGANNQGNPNEFGPTRVARVDGFTITGADHGGGVFASGYAPNLVVSNNRIVGNQGTYGGGIRIGHATLLDEAAASGYTNALNNNVNIHHNQVMQNGSLNGAGGGIALYTGANNYQVRENTVCGNFSTGNGGGIGHLGLSSGGTIANNRILFNQTFNQGVGVNGGGLFIGGTAPIVPNVLSSAQATSMCWPTDQGTRPGPATAAASAPSSSTAPTCSTQRRRPRWHLAPHQPLQQHRRRQHGRSGRRRHLAAGQHPGAHHSQHRRQQRQHGHRGRGVRRDPGPVHAAACRHRLARSQQRPQGGVRRPGHPGRDPQQSWRLLQAGSARQQHRLAQPLVLLGDRRHHGARHLRPGAQRRRRRRPGLRRPGGPRYSRLPESAQQHPDGPERARLHLRRKQPRCRPAVRGRVRQRCPGADHPAPRNHHQPCHGGGARRGRQLHRRALRTADPVHGHRSEHRRARAGLRQLSPAGQFAGDMPGCDRRGRDHRLGWPDAAHHDGLHQPQPGQHPARCRRGRAVANPDGAAGFRRHQAA
jgi:hypothetical protein